MGTSTGNTTGFKGKKDHINILELDIIIINTEKRENDNFNNFDNNKDYKKIKIFRSDKYYGEWEKLEFWFF